MKTYEVDTALAGIVAMASEQEQKALNDSIDRNGQIEDAVIWRGRLIDGRCRQIACQKIGKELRVREIPWDTSEEEVRAEVKALNTRRNLSITQKAMSAMKYGETHKVSAAQLAAEWGISEKIIKNARFVLRHKAEFVDPLFNGRSVSIVNHRDEETTSTALSTICSAIKRDIERSRLEVDTSGYLGFDEHAFIKTEAGKSWYSEFVTANNVSNIVVRMVLAEMANLKFKIKEV